MARQIRKPPQGAKLPDSADMKAWREEFEAMGPEEHLAKLKSLGLDEEELEEFKEMEEGGVPVEEEMLKEEEKEKTKKKIPKK